MAVAPSKRVSVTNQPIVGKNSPWRDKVIDYAKYESLERRGSTVDLEVLCSVLA